MYSDSWLGWNEKDKTTTGAITSIQRRYNVLFSGEKWIPLSDRSLQMTVYISVHGVNMHLKIRTLVNRNDMMLPANFSGQSYEPGVRWFDLVAGEEIHPETVKSLLSIRGRIAPQGNCLLPLCDTGRQS